MQLSWLQSALVGFVSGLSEPMPMSAEAHRAILGHCIGIDAFSPLVLLACHLASLIVVLMRGRLELGRLRRTQKILKTPPRRRSGNPELNSAGTLRLLRAALPIVLVGRLLGVYLEDIGSKLYLLSLTLLFSGILSHISARMRTANKDGRHLQRFDGMLMGLGYGLSCVPGISGVGAAVSLGLIRGAERRYAVRFAWILLSVGLGISLGVDVLRILGAGLDFDLTLILTAALAGVCAAAGTAFAIRLVQSLVPRGKAGLNGFRYYNWGLALLCLALFLLV